MQLLMSKKPLTLEITQIYSMKNPQNIEKRECGCFFLLCDVKKLIMIFNHKLI